MKETERLLRYTLPGLVFILILATLVCTYNFDLVASIIKQIDTINILASIITSGVMGYLFSKIYWGCLHLMHYPIDHTTVIKQISKNENKKLNIVDAHDCPVDINQEIDGWSIINAYWYVLSKRKGKLNLIQEKIDRLSNILHGLGASIVAVITSITTYFFIIMQKGTSCFSWSAFFLIIIIVFILWLMFKNYNKTKEMYTDLINVVIVNLIDSEFEKSNNPIKIIFPKKSK